MREEGRPWVVGTGALISVIIGLVIGFVIDQAPLVIAVALAIGTGLDMWLHRRQREL